MEHTSVKLTIKKLERNLESELIYINKRRTGREKRLDYVGLLKVKTPANVGQNGNSALLSDMIHNPT